MHNTLRLCSVFVYVHDASLLRWGAVRRKSKIPRKWESMKITCGWGILLLTIYNCETILMSRYIAKLICKKKSKCIIFAHRGSSCLLLSIKKNFYYYVFVKFFKHLIMHLWNFFFICELYVQLCTVFKYLIMHRYYVTKYIINKENAAFYFFHTRV